MAKMPEQSFEYDAPLIKLAHAWTRLSCDDDWNAKALDFGRYRRELASCLVDGSILSWVASGAGEARSRVRVERDLGAFGDLLRLASLRLIKMSIPKTVVDELMRASFTDDGKARINDAVKSGRMQIATEATRWTIGQRTYGTFQGFQAADDSAPNEKLQELLTPEKATGIPPTDYDHYLLACLSQKAFLTMDYRLAETVVKALRREVEIVEGQSKGVPKKRAPLKAPIVTPSVYLNQMLANNLDWKGQLNLARLESDSRLCHDLRVEYNATGQRLAELIESGQGTATEATELRGEWSRLENELQAHGCQLGFFDRLPPELKPTRWRELEQQGPKEVLEADQA